MKNIETYQHEFREIERQSDHKGVIGVSTAAWIFMIIGVIVTGTMTYSLTHSGMLSSALWAQWVAVAALLPVGLLEGSAVALVYGRHHWFRSSEQRRIAGAASWIVWALLAVTSVTHFAAKGSTNNTLHTVLSAYASYILPLAIVAVPMLWKRLYDLAPESATRLALLEAEADLKSEMISIQRQQNARMLESYRAALDTPRVTAARNALFERASIEHAKTIAGFIEDNTDQSALPPGVKRQYPAPDWTRQKETNRGN